MMKPNTFRLRQLFAQDSGFGLVEVLICIILLALGISQSLRLFSTTTTAVGKARLRDSLNAVIHSDLEDVRYVIEQWNLGALDQGMTSYSPDPSACVSGLATALLSDEQQLDGSFGASSTSTLDLSQSAVPLNNVVINRTINTLSTNNNLIEVTYSTTNNSIIQIQRKAILAIPAQGWCG